MSAHQNQTGGINNNMNECCLSRFLECFFLLTIQTYLFAFFALGSSADDTECVFSLLTLFQEKPYPIQSFHHLISLVAFSIVTIIIV